MKVTLRERKKNGKIALYLDYYNKGKRKTEYLSLYLIQNPKTKNERTVNKKTRELAETIWAQRQVEIQQGQYGFNDIEKLKGSFTTYITALAEKKNTSSGNYGNWYSMLKHFKAYRPTDITFQDLDKEFVEGFKDYLDKKAIGRANKPLSQNSKYSYYGKFTAALKQAVADGILKSNPEAADTSKCSFGSKSNSRHIPHLYISKLSVSVAPTGTFWAGEFGSEYMIVFNSLLTDFILSSNI